MARLRNRKRERFAVEVAAMSPLDRAYVLAGYADTPWARYNASKLAHVPEVADRIDELQTEFSDRSGIRAEYLQRKLLPLVEANPQDLFERVLDEKGKPIGVRLKNVTDLPRDLGNLENQVRSRNGRGDGDCPRKQDRSRQRPTAQRGRSHGPARA
jgi:Terminase small subunit